MPVAPHKLFQLWACRGLLLAWLWEPRRRSQCHPLSLQGPSQRHPQRPQERSQRHPLLLQGPWQRHPQRPQNRSQRQPLLLQWPQKRSQRHPLLLQWPQKRSQRHPLLLQWPQKLSQIQLSLQWHQKRSQNQLSLRHQQPPVVLARPLNRRRQEEIFLPPCMVVVAMLGQTRPSTPQQGWPAAAGPLQPRSEPYDELQAGGE